MSTDNVTPIHSGNGKPPKAPAHVRIEGRRSRILLEVMPFIETARRALDQDDHLSERQVLQHACEVLDEIAFEMEEIANDLKAGD